MSDHSFWAGKLSVVRNKASENYRRGRVYLRAAGVGGGQQKAAIGSVQAQRAVKRLHNGASGSSVT